MSPRFTWAAMLGLGAGVMYLLDPQLGNRRRALIRDKMRRFSRQAGERASAWSQLAAGRTTGVLAETRGRFRQGDVDDRTLVERVRSELGRVLTHVSAVNVEAHEGRVTLRGDVLEHEADPALTAARRTRGVRAVHDALERHARPGSVPSLQGTEGTESEDR